MEITLVVKIINTNIYNSIAKAQNNAIVDIVGL